MKTNFAILKICFLILITFFSVANAGELYQWVDKNGVKRFSDSPTDRDALIRHNAKSSPSFERKTSSTDIEPSGIQGDNLSSQSRETETAEGHVNSIRGSQSTVNILGKPASDEKFGYDRSVPVVTKDGGKLNSTFERSSGNIENSNQKGRENPSNVVLENQKKRQEIEEYNAKIRESNAKAAEIQRKSQEVEEYNAKVRKHNDQIKRQQYEDGKQQNLERSDPRGKTIDHGSERKPYIDESYHINRSSERKPYIDGNYHKKMRR